MKRSIKTASGAILGWIQDSSTNNGDKMAFNASGKLLGFYRKAMDITVDAQGKILYRGDALSSLVVGR